MIEWSNEGLPLCPECGKFYNPRCKNCFHNRSPEDPFGSDECNKDEKKDEPPQKPEEK